MEIKIVDKNCEGQRIVEISKNGTLIQVLKISSYTDTAIDTEGIKSLLEEIHEAGQAGNPFNVVCLEEY